jgi:hypothetical protein
LINRPGEAFLKEFFDSLPGMLKFSSSPLAPHAQGLLFTVSSLPKQIYYTYTTNQTINKAEGRVQKLLALPF